MADDDVANDPWKKISVLALDGGGTRGYASLLMLERLMNEIARIESGSETSQDDEHALEPHHSSFGPSVGDSRLVSRSAALEPMNMLTRPPDRTSRIPRRREIRQELLLEKSKYLPCHYFDYIGGTSTDECIDRYPEMAERIFGNKKLMAMRGLARDRYDATNLQNVIDDIVLERLPERFEHLSKEEQARDCCLQLASPDDLCKTVIVAKKDHKLDGPHLFRSYATIENDRHPHNPGPADTCLIWEAGRATSAAPNYFEPIKIEGHTYYDGGVGYNDPTEEVYNDILMRIGWDFPDRTPFAPILTLGTGTKPTLTQKAKGLVSTLKAGIKRLTGFKRLIEMYRRVVEEGAINAMGVTKRMRERADREEFKYFKWDGGEEVGALGLDNCKREAFTKMESGIHKYMEDRSSEIRETAELLVRKRRARFEDQDRWQRFAYCTLFDCPLRICEMSFKTRAKLKDHIEANHHEFHDPGSVADEQSPVMPDLRGPFGHSLRQDAT